MSFYPFIDTSNYWYPARRRPSMNPYQKKKYAYWKSLYKTPRYRRKGFGGTQIRGVQSIAPMKTASRRLGGKSNFRKRYTLDSFEKKYVHDTNVIQIPIGGNWITDGFGPYPTTGSGYLNRVGRRITLTSLSMRGRIELSALEALGTAVRLVVVYDKDPDGADATPTDMFSQAQNINATYGFKNESKGRFKFLYDQTFDFATDEAFKSFKLWFKGPTDVVFNNGDAGDVTDLEYGNFLIMACASGNAAVINVTSYFKFTFIEK